ncbi:MAG TPA: tetratricopeptide repeat protein [Alphaproteobacteria bacterium]|jgi:predicted O-linked N-acetylglucosamine transferase (SPINDLY family)/GT2 family glycosyltransferase
MTIVNIKGEEPLVSAVTAGQWNALRDLISHDPAGAPPVLRLIATGDLSAFLTCSRDELLPDYRLRKAVYPAARAADRLCTLARQAEAAGQPAFAATLYEVALAFDGGSAAASSALAWKAYADADIEAALRHAERANEAAPALADTAVTLGWMQWEAGRQDAAAAMLAEALRRDPHHATAHWYLGHVLERRGDLADAETHLRAALRLNPRLEEAAVTLAWTLAGAGRLDDALHIAEAAARQSPLPHRLAQVGYLLTEKGDHKPAIGWLGRAYAAEPDNPTTRRRFAIALSKTGRLAEAQALIEDGLRQRPGDQTLTLAHGILCREAGATTQAREISGEIVKLWPNWAEGWYLHGLTHLDEHEEAESHFATALKCDPLFSPALLEQCRILLRMKRAAEAEQLLRMLLDRLPDFAAGRQLLARALLDQNQPDQARPHLHRLLRRDRGNGILWTLLSIAMHKKGRMGSARMMGRRARRLAPHDTEALHHSAVMAMEYGDVEDALNLCRILLERAPGEMSLRPLASAIHLAAGNLFEAERHAELAVAHVPDDAESWRNLGHLRHRQERLAEAEEALQQAHRLAPERADILHQLGWLLVADDRLPEALIALEKACEAEPANSAVWLRLAEFLGDAGRHDEAVATARRALEMKLPPVMLSAAEALLGKLLFMKGHVADEDDKAVLWNEAAHHVGTALRREPGHREAGFLALRLQATGHARSRDLPRLIPSAQRRKHYVTLLEWLTACSNSEECRRVAAAAAEAFPRDTEISVAGLYLDVMAGAGEPRSMARQLRQWGLRHGMACGSAPLRDRPAATFGHRLRVAYLAPYFHYNLLTGILASHDPDLVELHLYTNDASFLSREIRSRVTLHHLGETDLATSCAANGIDVVVDTVGLHPFHGQADILRALRRRVAPIQCGWLGGWGNGAGLFDLLITDDVAIPAGNEDAYQEALLRLDGGQWSWTPPATAPAVTKLPALAQGHVTFGCDVRGLRLSLHCLETWAGLLAAIPGARLELMGRQVRDWEFRTRFAAILVHHGVDPDRVGYRYHRAYGDHLQFFQQIDISLDSFPSNGGLCLLDSLWMGTPVVTLAGKGLAAERQGASILTSAGCAAWIAEDAAGYVAIAKRLAADLGKLNGVRQGLRQQLSASPLLQPQRIAAALEQAWMRMRSEAQAINTAPDAKARSRLLARRAITSWLDRDIRLSLPSSDKPDVSVVVILFNQAGLSRETLTALADQQGVAFETIIVDNASHDETGALLGRVDGATILRNEENVGFLLAARQGAALARGRYVLFLNSDAYLHRDALAAAVRRIDSDPGIGIIGGRIVLTDGTLQEAGGIALKDGGTLGYGRGESPYAPQFQFLRDADFTSGAFFLVRHSLWLALDGFDATLAPAYYEDTDFCFRARRAGFRVVYDPAVVVSHLEWGSAASAEAAIAMINRNKALFLQRHHEKLSQRSLPVDFAPLRDRWAATPRPRLLVIDDAVPHQAGGAGLPRAQLMMRAIAGHHVTFFPLWGVDGEWSEVYQAVPPETEVILGEGVGALERFLERRRGLYDTLLVSRPTNMAIVDRIRTRRPALFLGMRIIYDAEAIFALREIVQAEVRGAPMPRAEAQRRIDAEIDLARRADCVLAVSEREGRLFRELGVRDVRILCHSATAQRTSPSHGQRQGLLFVGALHPNTPNEDSLLWLAEEILPRLNRKLGQAVPLAIVGECRSNRVAELASDQIELVGRIDDLAPFYDRARLFVAPTRFAAGVPAKVIEAACAGLPVVATQLLLDQLGWQAGKQAMGAQDAEGFAEAIAALYRDAALWQRVQAAALEQAETQFSPKTFSRVLNDALTGAA